MNEIVNSYEAPPDAENPPLLLGVIADDVPDKYLPFFGRGPYDAETLRSQLPYDSISFSLTPRTWRLSRTYKMVLYRDGRAELSTPESTPEPGNFVGEISLNTYFRLCYLIESSHFSEMKSSYRSAATDLTTRIVTVTSGASMTSVSDYGSVGPIQLWAIHETLDAVKVEIDWTPAE